MSRVNLRVDCVSAMSSPLVPTPSLALPSLSSSSFCPDPTRLTSLKRVRNHCERTHSRRETDSAFWIHPGLYEFGHHVVTAERDVGRC